MSAIKFDVYPFLEAHSGPEGVEEVIRQIRSGNISGDWVVWFFPATEDAIAHLLGGPFTSKDNLCGDEHFEKLRRYAIEHFKDAEVLIANPIFKGDLEKICSLLLEYGKAYFFKLFDLYHREMIWSSLTVFSFFCPASAMDRMIRLFYGEGNIDFTTFYYLIHNKREDE